MQSLENKQTKHYCTFLQFLVRQAWFSRSKWKPENLSKRLMQNPHGCALQQTIVSINKKGKILKKFQHQNPKVNAKALKQSHLTRSIYCAYYNYRKDLHGPFLPDLQYNITSLTIQDVCEEEMISKMLILPHKWKGLVMYPSRESQLQLGFFA